MLRHLLVAALRSGCQEVVAPDDFLATHGALKPHAMNPADPTPPITLDQNHPTVKLMFAETARMKEQLSDMDELNTRKLPVAIFERDFLPLFRGDKLTDAKERLQLWYRIAGSNFDPVNLIDKDGKIVIQVPPVSTNPYNPVGSDPRISMSARLADASTHRHNAGPRGADAALMRAVAHGLEFPAAIPKEIEGPWGELLAYFAKKGGASSAPGTSSSEESAFTYDD